MSDYTIKNLKRDVPDAAEKFGIAPNFEARFGREPLECQGVGVSYERLAPNFRSPFGHSHREQEEVYVVVSGSGRVKIDDEIHEIGPWDTVRVGRGTMRAFEAGPEGVEIVAFGAPAGGPSDAEIVHGWWSD